ncbi:MAG: hypothetical protein M0R66_06700 [Candidatus Omnitrophica bacterium]|nr:hypothetical protein [Candidatus Omnitrophota bacterium]
MEIYDTRALRNREVARCNVRACDRVIEIAMRPRGMRARVRAYFALRKNSGADRRPRRREIGEAINHFTLVRDICAKTLAREHREVFHDEAVIQQLELVIVAERGADMLDTRNDPVRDIENDEEIAVACAGGVGDGRDMVARFDAQIVARVINRAVDWDIE